MSAIEESGFLSSDMNAWITKNRSEVPAWFELCEDFNRLTQRLFLSLGPPRHDRRLVAASLVFSRIVSHFQVAILLTERGAITDATVIARSQLEATFVLGALKNDESFIDAYANDDEVRRAQLLRNWLRCNDEVLMAQKVHRPEFEKILKEINQSNKEQGIKELRTSDIAARAEMTDHYNTLYGLLSRAVHCRVRDLEHGIVLTDDESPDELIWGPQVERERLEAALNTTCEIMFLAVRTAVDLFGKQNDFNIAFEEMWNRFKVLIKKEGGT